VIERVGGLDEDFFMYGEDEEWCSRIKRSGWRIVYFPGATIIHIHRFSSGKADRALRVIECMAPVLVLYKRRGPFVAWCANAILLFAILIRLPIWAVRDSLRHLRGASQPGIFQSRLIATWTHMKGLFSPVWIPRPRQCSAL
jgi:GT2 family glycosyltransferase